MSDVQSLPEVTRFIVQVPATHLDDTEALRQQLCEMFPGRVFRIERNLDTENARAILRPVMEDDKGRAHICRTPDRNLLNKIYEAMSSLIPSIAKPA